MRIIAKSTLREYWNSNIHSEFPLLDWYEKTQSSIWNTPNEVKLTFRSADIIDSKRVVFDIGGNKYRLICDIEYRLKFVFVIWVGSHKEYDKIDVKNIKYE
ncbi:MAG: type II toxin-antitoxin system HigB family toxin [Bacteroidota bacterium]|nr:type II toxin-antitoxin system HigB family toxin [Bacteroidota bacterium]